MATVLIATDADAIADEVDAALADDETVIVRIRQGSELEAAVKAHTPDLCILDLQIGNMGAMACCMHLRHESSAGRLPDTAVLMLLDRGADSFLAKRSAADGWIIKPIDAFRLRKATKALLAGGEFTEEDDVVTVPAVAVPAVAD